MGIATLDTDPGRKVELPANASAGRAMPLRGGRRMDCAVTPRAAARGAA